jgi:hypothetical protein
MATSGQTIISNTQVNFHMHSGATISVPVEEGYELTVTRSALTKELVGWELTGMAPGHAVRYIEGARLEGISVSSDTEALRVAGDA